MRRRHRGSCWQGRQQGPGGRHRAPAGRLCVARGGRPVAVRPTDETPAIPDGRQLELLRHTTPCRRLPATQPPRPPPAAQRRRRRRRTDRRAGGRAEGTVSLQVNVDWILVQIGIIRYRRSHPMGLVAYIPSNYYHFFVWARRVTLEAIQLFISHPRLYW